MKKILISVFLLSFLGCSKENSSQSFFDNLLSSQRDQLPSEIQILELLQLPTDGYAAISSWATLSIQSLRGPEVMIRGFAYNKAATKSDFGALAFGPIVINPTSNTNLDYLTIGASGAKDLYGTTTTVSLAGKSGLPGFNTSFYIPKMMTITSPSFSNYSNISQGTIISWQPDVNNTVFGVGISIYYDPESAQNKPLNLSGNTIKNLIRTDDTGSYTISASDLAGIPANARLTLNIGRGNYQRVSMPDDYHIGLIAYSVVAHSFIKQ